MIKGIDINVKNVDIDGVTVTFRNWDLASEDTFKSFLPAFARDSRA